MKAIVPSTSCSTTTETFGWQVFRLAAISGACGLFSKAPARRFEYRKMRDFHFSRTQLMIRLCPNCNTERPVTEIFCEGTWNGQTCGWDLSTVDIASPGASRPSSKPSAAPSHGISTCRNGHPGSPGDLVCAVCGEP